MPDERYKLSEKEHEKIFCDIQEDVLSDTETQEQPVIIILGGQPGSGKSRLTEIAKESVFGNKPVAVINGDDYRIYHPQATEIYEQHDKKFAELTDPDVRKWTPQLLESAVNGRRDIVFEATMRNKEPLMSTIETLKEKGYRVGIMVMAVNEQVSKVGIVTRYESQKENGLIARWTPFEAHDEAYRNMPETVMAIEHNSSIEGICVYNRAGDLLYDNGLIEGVFKRPSMKTGADNAVRKEQSRPLSLEEKKTLDENIEAIRQKMIRRGAEKEFKELKRPLEGSDGR
jgi:UDP-N-acetylglucosamine kinase